MTFNILKLRKKLKLPPRGDGVSALKDQLTEAVKRNDNISGRSIKKTRLKGHMWGMIPYLSLTFDGGKQKILKAIKKANAEELPEMLRIAEEVSEKESAKRKREFEEGINNPKKPRIPPGLGFFAGAFAIGGCALAVQNTLSEPIVPLPLPYPTPFDGPYMAMFPPPQLHYIQNPADNDINRILSQGSNVGMAIAGGFLMEAMRLRTPEGKEQTKQKKIAKSKKKLNRLNQNFAASAAALNSIRKSPEFKNITLSNAIKDFVNTKDENIQSLIEGDNGFKIDDYDDLKKQINGALDTNLQDADQSDATEMKKLYDEFKESPVIKKLNADEDAIKKIFTEEIAKTIMYHKLRNSLVDMKEFVDSSYQKETLESFDAMMNDTLLDIPSKKIYLDTLLSSTDGEEISEKIQNILETKGQAIKVAFCLDEDASNIMNDHIAADLLSKLNPNVDPNLKAYIEPAIQLIALNHARNLYEKRDYSGMQKSKAAFR